MIKIINIALSFFFAATASMSQELARFTLNTGETEKIDAPVCIPLAGLNYNTDNGNLRLFEVTQQGEKEVACQLEPGYAANLWFVLPGDIKKSEQRKFVLKQGIINDKIKNPEKISLRKDEKDLTLLLNKKPILNYRFGVMYPPEGIDPLYKRSGFIHPLWSPGGEILSRIQAPDHYHHYGIWGPWTKTNINGREVDFWNLASGQGTVEFKNFVQEYEGEIFSGFCALQHHIDFGGKGSDQAAINELLDVRAWNPGSEGKPWIIDYTTNISTPLDSGILLEAYRYGGGIGFRATEKWTKDNCTVLTSDNKTRIDADGSFAKWCIVEGESSVAGGRSGILFLSHPSNRKHPEPMRVWPLDSNAGRGDMYFEFVPIRHEEWKLEPKKNYTLKYRMVVFDGKMETQTAEKYWNSFVSMPVVTFY